MAKPTTFPFHLACIPLIRAIIDELEKWLHDSRSAPKVRLHLVWHHLSWGCETQAEFDAMLRQETPHPRDALARFCKAYVEMSWGEFNGDLIDGIGPWSHIELPTPAFHRVFEEVTGKPFVALPEPHLRPGDPLGHAADVAFWSWARVRSLKSALEFLEVGVKERSDERQIQEALDLAQEGLDLRAKAFAADFAQLALLSQNEPLMACARRLSLAQNIRPTTSLIRYIGINHSDNAQVPADCVAELKDALAWAQTSSGASSARPQLTTFPQQ